MFLLIFAFALYSIIYPEIKKNENKYKIIATDMRADLELIMNDLKKLKINTFILRLIIYICE